jgi:hypothetical protein
VKAGIIVGMPFPPMPVTDVRDSWDWAIVWCTVGAAVLAAIAIWVAVIAIRRADRIAQEDRAAAVHERRNVFELGVLVRLLEICGHNLPGSVQVVQGLLKVLPDEDLPGLRKEVENGRMVSNTALAEFLPEYLEAVERRLGDGGARAVEPRRRGRLRSRLRHPIRGA